MSVQPLRTPLEILNKAMMLISNLRASLPGKVGKILTCMDEITNAWEGQDLEQFPFNLLHSEAAALAALVKSEYDNLDQDVDRRSSVYEQVINLEHRLRMSIEFVVSSKILQSVERRFQRIDEILPARNWAVRDLLSALSADHIGLAIKKGLETAVNQFERQEYKAVLQECGQAGEALFGLYKTRLAQCGCSDIHNNVGIALEQIRKWLANSENRDEQGCAFVSHSRVEWFLLSLFESLHYMRNVASHPSEITPGLPAWQTRHRRLFTEKPEYARLGLCLVFQIAIELQVILDHEGNQT